MEPHLLPSGQGHSKMGQDNPGIAWNLISNLKALEENSVELFLSTIW